ncbi:MAG: BTAD domain-containing putative transcriptional regulator [Burkholderiales bacterium]
MGHPRALFAKTTRPSCTGVLPRQRLFDLLDKARSSSVIWIAGPPGSGKTTLAASYLENQKFASLWYQVDETDVDVASFFYHLEIAAVAHLKRKSVRLPQLTPQHLASLPTFTRRYFQALYSQLGKSFAIVFDGYHEIAPQSQLHEVIATALAEVPPGASVIVISRTDPPPSMARLRANRALDFIGWRDLKLTQEETEAIAAQRGLELEPDQLRELNEKTEGWAAGLILMLEQAAAGAWSAPADLSTPQLVFDYLAGEIFQKTDSATRAVLLSTAYVPQMTAEMAETLSGQADAGERLDHLYRNNYFVTLKQAAPQSFYEYHPMMREFVASRTHSLMSREERQSLQRKSARLLMSHGLVAEAVALARVSGDWEQIAEIIRHHARELLDSGRSETLVQWVESLPKDFQDQHPWTLYWMGLARTDASPRESRRLHERAFDRFSQSAEPDLLGMLLACSGAMDAILFEVDDFSLLDRWIEIMDRLLREHPELVSGSLEARIVCSLFTSLVLRQPHHPEIEYWAERAQQRSREQTDINARMSVEPRIALGIAYGGHFPKAWSIIEEARELAKEHEIAPLVLIKLKVVEATYFMLTGQREPCYKAVREGLAIESAEGVNVLSRQLLCYGAGGALAAGDLETAAEFLDEATTLPGIPARFDLCLHHLFSTWLAMRHHDALKAYQQQKLALRMAIEVGCPVFEVLCRIASALVYYEGQEPRAAWLQFQQVYDIARRIQNHFLEFSALLPYAYIALDSGRRPRSGMRALKLALSVGKPRNYLSFPLWRPEMLARLCSVALEADIETNFVSRLIEERSLQLDATNSALLNWPWPLRVQTLGQFRVTRDGEPIAFTGKVQRRPLDLLKVVIAYGGRDVSEERVVEALWPRIDGDSAHRSFATTLHRLRKLLGEEKTLQLSDGKLTLDGRHIWVDTWAFDQIVSRINTLLHTNPDEGAIDNEAAMQLCAQLLERYAGPFLESEAEQGWALQLRDRLRQRFVRAVADLARYWREGGDAERAIDVLEQALERDYANESSYRSLMECYAALGRTAEAADTYSRCRKMLTANLGVDPSPETTALYEKLIHSA